jgi:hypothetical protein
LAFEHAFPLPATVLALGLIAAGFLLAKGESLGRPLSFTCAGALIFLGLLDFRFSLLNGLIFGAAMNALTDMLPTGGGPQRSLKRTHCVVQKACKWRENVSATRADVIQLRVVAVELSPPAAHAAAGLSIGKKGVEDNTIDATVSNSFT